MPSPDGWHSCHTDLAVRLVPCRSCNTKPFFCFQVVLNQVKKSEGEDSDVIVACAAFYTASRARQYFHAICILNDKWPVNWTGVSHKDFRKGWKGRSSQSSKGNQLFNSVSTDLPFKSKSRTNYSFELVIFSESYRATNQHTGQPTRYDSRIAIMSWSCYWIKNIPHNHLRTASQTNDSYEPDLLMNHLKRLMWSGLTHVEPSLNLHWMSEPIERYLTHHKLILAMSILNCECFI